MGDMTDLLRGFLSPAPIYQSAYDLALVLSPLAGVLLILAIKYRIVETQLSSNQGAAWGSTIRAILLGIVGTALYFFFGGLIAKFANNIYSIMNGIGSIDIIMKEFDGITASIEQKATNQLSQQEDQSIWDYFFTLGKNISLAPALAASFGSYMISLQVVVIIAAFARILHAIIFSVVFVLGLILIPMGITKTFNLRGGMKVAGLFLFFWPIVESIMLGAYTLLIRTSIKEHTASSTNVAASDMAAVLTTFSIIHWITVLIIFAAFGLTSVIIVKGNPASSILTPIAAFASNITGAGRLLFRK